jgi:pimeloyl-ACP methyl ester carboxylesterase
MPRIISAAIGLLAVCLAMPCTRAQTDPKPLKGTTLTPDKTGYAPVNGLKLYYEISGTGKPLVLLHGGLGSTATMAPLQSQLIAGRQVIAVDLRGHGRTADTDQPLVYESMADDIYALIGFLKLDKPDVMGYSLGGGTAMRLAIQHPDAMDRLVLVSTAFRRNAMYPELLAATDQMGPQAAEMMKPSPLYKTYAAVAPRPQDWTRLVVKIGELLRRDYDWSKDLGAIRAKTLLVYGDADSVPVSHIAEFYALIGGSQHDAGWMGEKMSKNRLAILPGRTHYDISTAPELAETAIRFLDSK